MSKEAPRGLRARGENALPTANGPGQRCLPSLPGEPLRGAGRAQSSTGAPGQNPHLGQTHSGAGGSRWDSSGTKHSLVGALGSLDWAGSPDTGLSNQPGHLAPVLAHPGRFGMPHLAPTASRPLGTQVLGSELGEGDFRRKGDGPGGRKGLEAGDKAGDGAGSPCSFHHEGRASLLGSALGAGRWDDASNCWGGAGSS